VGIVCVTKANQANPWLLFEGGALAKHKVLQVFLIDASPADISPPLGMYQHTRPSRDDVLKLLHTIDAKLPQDERRGSDRLARSCDKNWPELEAAINQARELNSSSPAPPRDQRDVLEELVVTTREIAAAVAQLSWSVPLSAGLTHLPAATVWPEPAGPENFDPGLKNELMKLVELQMAALARKRRGS